MSNLTAVVTGANTGIGKEIAHQLVAAGQQVEQLDVLVNNAAS